MQRQFLEPILKFPMVLLKKERKDSRESATPIARRNAFRNSPSGHLKSSGVH